MDKIPIEIQLQNEVESLENRLRCYHEGTYGRSVVKMHVELKKIERIKYLLEQRQETRPHETIVIGWVEIEGNERLYNRIVNSDTDIKFDNGEVCKFADEWPFALATHFYIEKSQ